MIPFNFFQFIVVGIIFIFLVQCSGTIHQNREEAAFNKWLTKYKRTARINLSISEDDLEQIFDNVEYNPRIIDLDRNQKEFVFTKDEYLSKVVTASVTNNGKTFLREHKDDLIKIAKEQQIPPYLIVAFLGLETRFATRQGNYKAAEVLATLAYDKRRRDFFTQQLNSFLILVKKGYLKPDAKSSWAGALGAAQFMPTTYLYYGVDGDNNNNIDLISDFSDIFASTANYLRSLGWDYYKKWGYEVTVPANFDYSLASLSITKPIYVWETLGVKRIDNKPFPTVASDANLISTENHRVFLVTSNFKVILQWNRSISYALAVGLISDQLEAYYNTLNLNNKQEVKPMLINSAPKATVKKRTAKKADIKPAIKKKTKLVPVKKVTPKKPIKRVMKKTAIKPIIIPAAPAIKPAPAPIAPPLAAPPKSAPPSNIVQETTPPLVPKAQNPASSTNSNDTINKIIIKNGIVPNPKIEEEDKEYTFHMLNRTANSQGLQ